MCVYLNMHIYTYMDVCVYIYIYIYMYIGTERTILLKVAHISFKYIENIMLENATFQTLNENKRLTFNMFILTYFTSF